MFITISLLAVDCIQPAFIFMFQCITGIQNENAAPPPGTVPVNIPPHQVAYRNNQASGEPCFDAILCICVGFIVYMV